MKIAVISDTHDLLRPEVKELISGCDGVIHGGDVNSQKLLDEIKEAAGRDKAFWVVRGNNDRAWAKDLPFSLAFSMQGVKVFLVHNKKDIPKYLGDVQIVIYGHSHKYSEEMLDGRLWLNPGSCGKKRFHLPVTMAVLHLETIAEESRRADVGLFQDAEVESHRKQGEGLCGNFGKLSWWVEKIELDEAGEKRKIQEVPAKQADFSEGKLVGIVTEIFTRMDKGQTISYIAQKVGMDAELVEQICRIRVTHPGVTPGGVVDKMEVNRVVTK